MANIGLISIIVPVYNVRKYVKKCIESIKQQSYDNIEIIVVDDGSTDGSGEVCDSLKSQNIRIFHKENGGLSSARNYGLKKAKGEYVGFVDSDDFIERDMFLVLAKLIKEYSADVSACGYIMTDGKTSKKISKGDKILTFDKEELFKNMFDEKGFGIIACNKLFKKELFDSISFPDGQHFEDVNTMYKIFSKTRCLVYTPEHYYFYVKRQGSINDINFESQKYNKKNDDLFSASMEVFSYIKQKHKPLIKWVAPGCVVLNLRVLNQRILFDKDISEIYKVTKKIIKENAGHEFYSMLNLRRKIEVVCFNYCLGLYCVLIKIMKRRVG